MTEVHSQAKSGNEGGLGLAFALTMIILAVEVVAGLAANSLALLADAGHILTDVVALGLAWFAIAQARRPADERRTYGYHRVSILTALANGTTLVLIVIWVAWEAIQRFAHPPHVQGGIVIVSASVAILVNGFIALRLRGHGSNLNIRAALLHVVGDLAASVGVVIAGVLILTTGWSYADPAISLAISALIAWGAIRIVLETVQVLLEGVPKGLDLATVQETIDAVKGVDSVHDLHVWTIASDEVAMSCHVLVDSPSSAEGEHIVRVIEQKVCSAHGIGHTTIQLESCHPCAEDSDHLAGVHNHPHPTEPVA